MSSHSLSYQSMMPVNVPQVNATTTVVVSISASSVGPIVGLPDSPTSTLLPPSLAGWLVVAFHNRSFFPLSLIPPKTFKFYSSVCNILAGIHLSLCVDGLDSGRVLLHPNPALCQSSHERMSRPDRDVIWPNHGIHSQDSNISTLKGLSINKLIMVSWSRPDKTRTEQH
jgi:hypothetical protein